MPDTKPMRFAHELDAAWIMALWKAIHGGDPTPEHIAIEAIAALSGTLTAQRTESVADSSFTELQRRLREIGVEFEREGEETTPASGVANASADQPSGPIRLPATFCIIYGTGKQKTRYCITIPKPRYTDNR